MKTKEEFTAPEKETGKKDIATFPQRNLKKFPAVLPTPLALIPKNAFAKLCAKSSVETGKTAKNEKYGSEPRDLITVWFST